MSSDTGSVTSAAKAGQAPASRWPRSSIVIACLMMLSAALALHAGANSVVSEPQELTVRRQIRADVQQRLAAGDFAGLEQLATTLRTSKERTGSGVWKLSLFYRGIEDAAAIGPRDTARWRQLADRIAAWRAAYPEAPTPYLAAAIATRKQAWASRPRQIVHEASTASDATFIGGLMAARRILEDNRAVASADPHYYALWAGLAAALGEDDAALLEGVEPGLAREPGYHQIYLALLDQLGPHVAKDGRALEALANTAVQRSREIEGSALYVRIYWYAKSRHYGPALFTQSQADWPRMKTGIGDLLSHYPDAWNLNLAAALACLAEDRELATDLLGRIGDAPIVEVWSSRRAFDGCRARLSGDTAAG